MLCRETSSLWKWDYSLSSFQEEPWGNKSENSKLLNLFRASEEENEQLNPTVLPCSCFLWDLCLITSSALSAFPICQKQKSGKNFTYNVDTLIVLS